MDPITTAVIAALAAGVTQGSVADAYNCIKQLIKTKLGNKNDVIDVIQNLEKEPDSTGYKIVLQEKIQKSQLEQDTDIFEAAKKLMDEIESTGDISSDESYIIQKAEGNFIIQTHGDGKASITINR